MTTRSPFTAIWFHLSCNFAKSDLPPTQHHHQNTAATPAPTTQIDDFNCGPCLLTAEQLITSGCLQKLHGSVAKTYHVQIQNVLRPFVIDSTPIQPPIVVPTLKTSEKIPTKYPLLLMKHL
ncbi:hypothetical protein L596_001795 [Steinernema carpocapsae]|uniref:Uncharacterized protein n=1 Tax=Steinernema carpocapsae TaxID=34508 RepID=A0A4U8UPC0_STECR|nr:hypothetical protein L596_001795 [Steinernema carpocapsae]